MKNMKNMKNNTDFLRHLALATELGHGINDIYGFRKEAMKAGWLQ